MSLQFLAVAGWIVESYLDLLVASLLFLLFDFATFSGCNEVTGLVKLVEDGNLGQSFKSLGPAGAKIRDI